MGELVKHKPIMPGKTEKEQIGMIVDMLGTPSEKSGQTLANCHWPAHSNSSNNRTWLDFFRIRIYNNY